MKVVEKMSCFGITAFFHALCRWGRKGGNFKTRKFFNCPESSWNCLYSKVYTLESLTRIQFGNDYHFGKSFLPTACWEKRERESVLNDWRKRGGRITLGSIFIFWIFWGDFFRSPEGGQSQYSPARKITNMFVIISNGEDGYAAPSTKLRN